VRWFLILLLTAAAYGHETITTKITWSQEIARIVQKRCIACHAKEPVDFSSYESARPWAKAIKEEVLNRRMPPWGAVKGFGEFRDDLGLSQEEINTFAEWVEGGAPEGDPNLLPPDRFPDPPGNSKRRGLRVRELPGDTMLEGIRPLASAPDVQITAMRPDGSVEPLIWLRDYREDWHRTFFFRSPLTLPRGTKIDAPPDFPFELIIRARKPAR
jgi:hypothetical protein